MGAFTRKHDSVICLGFLAGLVLLLVLLFPIPPLFDYPNHLARIWLLSGGADLAPVNHFYAVDWHGIATNIGIDLAARLVGHMVAPPVLGGILLALGMLLPPLGAVALNARVFGGAHPWQPFFLLFWCSLTLLAGLLNFQIGLGIALLAAAVDPALQARGMVARLGGRIGLGVLLLLVHPFGLLFYCTLLGGLAFGGEAVRKGEWRPRLKRAIMAAAVCLVPLALFFIWTKRLPGEDAIVIHYAKPAERLRALLTPFGSYDDLIDVLFAIPFLALVLHGVRRRRFDVHAGLLRAAVLLAAGSLIMPRVFRHESWLDHRLPVMVVFAALAGTRLVPRAGREGRMLLAAVALVGLRTAWIGLDWRAAEPLIGSVRQALAEVPAGATVLPLQHMQPKKSPPFSYLGRSLASRDETFRHYAALAVPWRHAFEPMLFTQQGVQPVKVLPSYADIAYPPGGRLFSVHALDVNRRIPRQAGFIRQWRRFDYVLVLNADRPDRDGPFDLPPELQLVTDRGFACLYRVTRTDAGP